MELLETIAVTPAGAADASLAIAACRAGALGVLDLEYATDAAQAADALARLERFTTGPIGIKLGPHSGEILSRPPTTPGRLGTVLLAGGEHAEAQAWIDQLRARGIRTLWEATSLAEARAGAALGADALVLKGNESGGRVGSDPAFMLLQRWFATDAPRLPVFVQGGIGLHSAAACVAAGAVGIVLDAQLLLARESPLSRPASDLLSTCDGSETVCLGERLGQAYRFYSRPGLSAVEEMRGEEDRLASGDSDAAAARAEWSRFVRSRVATEPARGVWLVGQDAAFARPLAARFRTVGGIIGAVRQSVRDLLAAARTCPPLAAGGPLARSHGTRYPVVQGPMTRVSDTPAFAEAVAVAGALPFVALALLRRAEAERLLQQTRGRLGQRPWGAGILGFAPPEVRREQAEAIRAVRPPLALIAGGRPDQARELEAAGIPTYLHVPSPGLLRMFLREGALRFVFEGRECGGHVGPRSSFLLWEEACAALAEHLGPTSSGEGLHVLFAGGVHDARSAAMVSAMAAGLAARGAAVGVLIGTAYLFTAEAVATGAITPRYQREALACRETVLLETGPGHAIRCLPTPYAEDFERQRRRLQQQGLGADVVREALEALNVGRLRVATKGLERRGDGPDGLVAVDEEVQHSRGMYMIGQVAALRDRVVSMAELHEDVSTGSARLLQGPQPVALLAPPCEKPSDVAIIGMACFFPGAGDLRTFWENVLARVDAVTEVPASHWDWRLYYDPDPRARDKITSRWGGFLADVPFDPLAFGMPPNSLRSIEPVQLLVLDCVRRALADAGYAERPFARDRTAVVVGAGGGAAQLAMGYGLRSYLPMLATVPGLNGQVAEVVGRAALLLPEWTEDSFPGILVNVIAGRVANRFDLGGPSFAVDAACGSSLAALYAGVRELETLTSDVAVVVGADTVQNPFTYLAFSKTHAFSPRGRCHTFDESADGIVISEGVAVVVLKRLPDAERDGDRVYAVIKGVGASSDGRDKGLTAPRPEGQLRALERAYAKAGVSPARVGFVEAHGTGTVAGDQAEVQALAQVFRAADAAGRGCAVGSVKSLIGHTKCAAGLAGLVNGALALHHKALPPLPVRRPNAKARFEEGPFFLNTQARPWVHGGESPRCAGVSAFGFGGTNFHAVLEEYAGAYLPATDAPWQRWPAELFVWRRSTAAELAEAVRHCHDALADGAHPPLDALAQALWRTCSPVSTAPVLAVVASSAEDLRDKLAWARQALADGREAAHDPRGVFLSLRPAVPWGENGAKVAFLFPGQGSQYPDMLASVALAFPEVRAAFDEAERALAGALDRPLGRFIFPPSPFGPEQEQEARQALARTDVAQPALGAAGIGLCRLLARLGIEPDLLAGHSYGDYTALWAAGVMDAADLVRISHRRGRLLGEAAGEMPGAMAALQAGPDRLAPLLKGIPGVVVANFNGPQQTVISGTEEGVCTALERASQQDIRGQRLSVSCAFHSPQVETARQPFVAALALCRLRPPRLPVYASTTGALCPDDPGGLTDLLARHLVSPVRFQQTVEALHAAGARVFIEVGPQGVLTGLVEQILEGRPHLALAADARGRPGLVPLLHLLARLLAVGMPVRIERLFEGRPSRPLDLARLGEAPETLPASTWLVNSVRARPLHGPEPRLLGQPLADPPADSTEAATPAHTPPARDVPPPVVTQVTAPPAPAVPHAPATEDGIQVMLRFQELMDHFLETQRSVMLGYLQPPVAASVPLASLEPASAPPVAASGPPVNAEPASGPPAATNGHVEPAGNSREALTHRLLQIVCQRTGYPVETLGLDLDLEADLGIDSIKRVEILGMLAEAGPNGDPAVAVDMEALTGIKTLGGIITCLLGQGNGSGQPSGADKPSPAQPPPNGAPRGGIQRRVVRAVAAPVVTAAPNLPIDATLLLTDDGRGVARALAGLLRTHGQSTALLRTAAALANGDDAAFVADLSDPRQVEETLARVRQRCGPVTGLIHLLPLAAPPPGDTWARRLDREVRSLFLLGRGLDDDLRRAASRGPAFFVGVTAMGGAFGADPSVTLPRGYFPGQGGVAGLVKSLAHEWPDVLTRAVDLDPDTDPAEAAQRLLAELGDPAGPVETGYRDGRRWTLVCRPALLDSTGPGIELGADSTILLTGGARGITAAVAHELARRYRPTLVLVGRSPLPEGPEPADTAGLVEPGDLKAALLARSRREGRPAPLAGVEAAYRRLLRDREIRTSLDGLRAAGARVHYHSADVRSENDFGVVLAEVRRRFGRLDGVIHGAGVIQDKRIRDKTPESFDHVFGTKVDSAHILARHLRFDELKFCVFFSSVAGRFGNVGQTDYAAANEVLSKLAHELDRRGSCRVVAVAWGPWSGIGMVSELQEHLGRRGLEMIPADVGPGLLVDELLRGPKGDCEVVIAGDVGQLARPAPAPRGSPGTDAEPCETSRT
jgi:acyl transferase domain-containing protein/NAD(P)H-dependent flavin oxidoreductase YrpB (nitropropane dioxygenase family)/NAD(P)-dependent dehydrogenase (short-subunit alcohol dehydrogenase family)